jgi:hypothetical protein
MQHGHSNQTGCRCLKDVDTLDVLTKETCQDNGLLMLKFADGVWPFKDSATPPGKQN